MSLRALWRRLGRWWQALVAQYHLVGWAPPAEPGAPRVEAPAAALPPPPLRDWVLEERGLYWHRSYTAVKPDGD